MNVIEVNNLSKSYGELKAVDNISFNVAEGELLCVLHTNKDETVYNKIKRDVLSSFEIVDEFVPKEKVIKEVIVK